MPAAQQHHLRILLATSLLASVVLSGCGGSSDDSQDPTLTSLWDSGLNSCGTNCHNASGPDGLDNGPDMSTKTLFYSNMVNKTVSDDYPNWVRGGDCDDTPFINPNNPAKSTILTGLVQSYADAIVASGDCSTSSYNIHEVNQVSLSNTTALVDWINQGAPNN